GFLIEHFAGDFPVWLAPEQVRIVPIADRHVTYARSLQDRLAAAGLRSEVDESNERMNAKIRDAELYKVPYIAVAADQKEQPGTASFRGRQERRRNGAAGGAFRAHSRGARARRLRTVEPIAPRGPRRRAGRRRQGRTPLASPPGRGASRPGGHG